MHDTEPPHPTHVTALDHSIAAAGNINIEQLVVRLRAEWLRTHLAPCANKPGAITCAHCRLPGLSPDADRCPACQHDVGVARRAREAKLAREQRIRSLMADGRRVCCYIATLALLSVLYDLAHGLPEHGVGAVLSYATAAVVFTLFVGELMVYGWICLEVWINTRLPPWLHRHGLGWLTGAN